MVESDVWFRHAGGALVARSRTRDNLPLGIGQAPTVALILQPLDTEVKLFLLRRLAARESPDNAAR